ncbi:MAG: 30S ribosomal protein S18 [Trueperaceae bacterium]|nr:30S ribosomal protein S18 [Trueperaceae bacterium]MCH2666462.1 30S ribosomal protein S18 [Deinococcales bacterium]
MPKERDNNDRDRRTRRGAGGRRGRRPKVCQFCSGDLEITNYHDQRMLRRFISDTAKILPRRRTGVCAKHQRRLATTIKRARMLAIIPITQKLVRK